MKAYCNFISNPAKVKGQYKSSHLLWNIETLLLKPETSEKQIASDKHLT